MRGEAFLDILGADFYAGVPDSQLKGLCDCLLRRYGTDPRHHVIAANEGNCAALAAGYYLATGRVPVVYLQNSGQGNIINPVASLLSEQVYAIPVIFVIGWRGEPGVHDEPQHICQGAVTLRLLEDMDISAFVVGKETTETGLREAMARFRPVLEKGRSVAFVIRKEALFNDSAMCYTNTYTMTREEVIRHIVRFSGEDPVIATTGKASRELFEIREARGEGHKYDFLTVGSMGHSSSVALGIALQKRSTKVWCLDGDGAVLMHMGAMAVIGASRPDDLVHIVLNNAAHETVGGMPTVADRVDLAAIAVACGYDRAVTVASPEALDSALQRAKENAGLSFIEVKCAIGSRAGLGRPTTSALENRNCFMQHLQGLS